MHKYAYVCKGLIVKYGLLLYFVELTLKYDLQKYEKYAFEKYDEFENTSMFQKNRTGQRPKGQIQ